MSKSVKTIIIIFVLILVLAGLWYIYNSTRPTQEEINNSSANITVVPTDVLSGSLINQLNNHKENGTLPISIGAGEKGRDNPFASF